MADDRLDDAIDAVVRAVDRIERATRAHAQPQPSAEAQPAVMPPPAGFGEPSPPPNDLGWAAPPAPPVEPAMPSHGFEFTGQEPAGQPWAPPQQPQWEQQPEPQPQQAWDQDHEPMARTPCPNTLLEQPAPPQGFAQAPPAAPPPQPGSAPAPTIGAPLPPPWTATPHGVPAEVHELVGRIVGRTQALETNLEAARALRAEISDLISRLAEVATRHD